MPVAAPPSPPARTDALEALREQALIEEARQRARRRHRRYAAGLTIATAIIGTGAVFAIGPGHGGAQPSAAARPLAPAAPSATHSTIVFSLRHGDATAALYRINPDGGGLHRLLSRSVATRAGRWASWPTISPDGRQVAFQTGDEPRTAIDVVDINGNNFRQITRGGHPAWSPDGTKIAFRFPNSSNVADGIYVSRADGTGRHRLARYARDPSWSPDGTKLAYICIAPQTYVPNPYTYVVNLCVMNADGTRQHRIAAVNDFATAAWSPDGSRIAFLGGRLAEMHVYIVNANGTNLRRLPPPVSSGLDCGGPAWSPNGKLIAFSPIDPFVFGSGMSGIYLMDPNGRNVVHVKGTTGLVCAIDWQRTPA